MSPFSVAGKRIVVTGGARGIGASVCRALVQGRAHIAVFDIINSAKVSLPKYAGQGEPGLVLYKTVDVSDRTAVFSAVNASAAELGGLDAVVNCAAIERSALLQDVSEADLTRTLDVNVKGAFFLAQAAFSHMKERGGVILNFGSDGGLTGAPGISTYSASKGALHSLNRMIALEWGKYGIRANALLPLVMTPMFAKNLEGLSVEERAAWDAAMRQTVPLKSSKGSPLGDCDEDLSPVVQFMLSDASKFITGQLVPINGGAGGVR